MASKKVILCPNPFRDERLAAAKRSKEILENVGLQTVVCLPFNREGYGEELGVPIRPLQQEIKSADLLIAFGGDGTILHLARTVALHRVPVLGINLGSLGFMSELELNELDRLRDLKDWNFTVESRMMLDVSVVRGGRTVYNTIALNDAVISKGSIARVVRLNIFTEEGFLTRVGGDGVDLDIFKMPNLIDVDACNKVLHNLTSEYYSCPEKSAKQKRPLQPQPVLLRVVFGVRA